MSGLTKLSLGVSLVGLCAQSLFSQGVLPELSLQGAGATFPAPLYMKWATEYAKVNPGVSVSYEGVGSGAGIKKILEGSVDFGASDAPMTEKEKAQAKRPLLHLPATMGAVAVAFNVPGVDDLQLDANVLSGIFLGQIKKWNDPRVAAINGGAALPDLDILVAYRSDSSGTTAVFTEYLSKVSAEWNTQVGTGKALKFPTGCAAKGSEGVSAVVKANAGGVSYMDMAFAKKNGLGIARIRNRCGNFIYPTPEGVSAAASGHQIPEDLCFSITNGAGPMDYPIASLSYLLVYAQQPDPSKGCELVKYLAWALHQGQAFAAGLDYAPLPTNLVDRVMEKVNSIH